MYEEDAKPFVTASAAIPVAAPVPAAVPMSGVIQQQKLGAKCCEFLIFEMPR